MTSRWVFTDEVADETWTVPINPDSMTSPEPPAKNVTFASGKVNDLHNNGRTVTFLGKPTSREWEFGGAIRTQAHYEGLVAWAAKTNDVLVTDHIGRTWRVLITDFLPTERPPTPRTPWRLRYTVKTTIIERVT